MSSGEVPAEPARPRATSNALEIQAQKEHEISVSSNVVSSFRASLSARAFSSSELFSSFHSAKEQLEESVDYSAISQIDENDLIEIYIVSLTSVAKETTEADLQMIEKEIFTLVHKDSSVVTI